MSNPSTNFTWILAVGLALLSIVLINLSTWQRFQDDPVVISIERDYKQWNTSFPALTFCPFNKTDHNAAKLISQTYGTENMKNIAEFIQMLTETTLNTLDHFLVNTSNAISSADYVDIILNTSFKFKFDTLTSNMNPHKENSLWMSQIFSERGVCYTFASKIAKYQDPRHYVMNHNNITFYPSLVGNPLEGDIVAQIVNMNAGGLIHIHNDLEVPDIVTKSVTAPNLYFKTIEVTALSIISSSEISSLRKEQRKCQHIDEGSLSLRPIYTYNLCRMECRMKLSFQLCNCVPHFYWGLSKNDG